MPRPIRILLKILAALVALFLLFLAVSAITEFKPEDTEDIAITQGASTDAALAPGSSFTMMTWNIGYCGLSSNAEFFMDGGTSVFPCDKEKTNSNLQAAIETIQAQDPDVLFIQEADQSSTRSYYIDELASLRSSLSGYDSSFANNFKTLWIPYPIPMLGKVDSGVATFSRYAVSSASRIQLPIPFKWPISMFNLKRCLLVNRVKLEGTDKELVLVNLHLEAYDSGEGKIAQTKQLKEFLQQEADKGNYVIAGGDFNQTFSSTDASAYPAISDDHWMPGLIDVSDFGSDFTFAQDSSAPTCRSLDHVLDGADTTPGVFQYYVIDGFIVSNNVTVSSCSTLDCGFVNSDHNPVLMQVSLND